MKIPPKKVRPQDPRTKNRNLGHPPSLSTFTGIVEVISSQRFPCQSIPIHSTRATRRPRQAGPFPMRLCFRVHEQRRNGRFAGIFFRNCRLFLQSDLAASINMCVFICARIFVEGTRRFALFTLPILRLIQALFPRFDLA